MIIFLGSVYKRALKAILTSLEAWLSIFVAVMGIVGAKAGANKKLTVMLNNLFSMIYFLPGVDSSEDFSSPNYFDYSGDANKNSTTISSVTDVEGTTNKKVLTDVEIAGIIIGAIVTTLGLIVSVITLYGNIKCVWCKDQAAKINEENPQKVPPEEVTPDEENPLEPPRPSGPTGPPGQREQPGTI